MGYTRSCHQFNSSAPGPLANFPDAVALATLSVINARAAISAVPSDLTASLVLIANLSGSVLQSTDVALIALNGACGTPLPFSCALPAAHSKDNSSLAVFSVSVGVRPLTMLAWFPLVPNSFIF